MKNTNDIKNFVKILYTENEINTEISDNILNFLDDDWEENYDSPDEWYIDYGRGEAEDIIINEIINKISKFLNEPADNWYFNDKYGDIDEIIYEVYPQLQNIL